MKTCPHCGATLAPAARFCPRCMTTLTEKRVIPTPKHLPIRWLSVTVAVLVLCVAVWAVWRTWPQGGDSAAPAVVTTTPVSTTESNIIGTVATTAASIPTLPPTLTSLSASASAAPSTSTSSTITASTTTTATAAVTSTSTSTSVVSSTTNTTRWTTASATVTTQSAPTTSTTKQSTTTTTPTQPAVKKYPIEWDTVYRSTTEDGLPIEEVTWSYETIKQYWHLSSMNLGTSYTVYKTYRYEIPLSECIVITGFDAPTSNGIYRIPAAIDGKVVVALDMTRQVSGWCHFNDADIAPTVQRLYLPPELFVVDWNTINRCTSLRAIHVTSHTLWLEPKAVPASTKGLCFYSEFSCNMSYAAGGSPSLASYCDVLNYKDGFYGRRGSNQYHGADWEVSSFASKELYGGGGT